MRIGSTAAEIRRAALAAAFGLSMMVPSVGYAAPCSETDGVHRVSLVVDTSALLEESAVIQERVREGLAVTLRDLEILPAKQASEPTLRVELRQADGDAFRYGFSITLERGELRQQALRHSGECESCTEGEIVARVLTTVDTLGEELCEATAPEAEEAETAPTSEPVVEVPPPRLDRAAMDDPDPADVGDPSPSGRRRLGPVGVGGVASLSVGGVALGVGVALALRQPTPLEDRPLFVRSTETPGVAVASVGAGLLLTGVILLLIDRRRTRRSGGPSYAASLRGGASRP